MLRKLALVLLINLVLSEKVVITLTDDHLLKTITSPNFPKVYRKNAVVEYEVQVALSSQLVQSSSTLMAYFEMFALEASDKCSKDFVEIHDGPDSLYKFCGATPLGKRLKLDTLSPVFRFVSDGQLNSLGFSIQLELVKSDCVKEIDVARNQVLQWTGSPGNGVCSWKLNASPENRLVLKFNEMNIPSDEFCSSSNLEIGDVNFGEKFERFCGKKTPSEEFESQSNELLIKLNSNEINRAKSMFSLNITLTEEPFVVETEPVKRSCPCGEENGDSVARVATRIMGGTEVRPAFRYPWLAALTMSWGEVFCGAALINDRYLLTAAHCLHGLTPNEVRVLLSAHDLRARSSAMTLPVESITIHENYNRIRQTHDIAVVKLKTPIVATSRVSCICIPMGNQETFDDLRVAGWGRTDEGGAMSDVLLEVKVPQIDQGTCVQTYRSLATAEDPWCPKSAPELTWQV
ncbi:Coagulation factor X [Halotydeus destructor]|nr:Coagulation factor X [Halotydeus destructor]